MSTCSGASAARAPLSRTEGRGVDHDAPFRSPKGGMSTTAHLSVISAGQCLHSFAVTD